MPGFNSTGLPDPGDYFIGRGCLFFALIDDNITPSFAPLGFNDLGNSNDFSMSITEETVEHVNLRTAASSTDVQIVSKRELSLSFSLEEINFDNLSLWLSAQQNNESNLSTYGAAPLANTLVNAAETGIAAGDPGAYQQGQYRKWYDIADINTVAATGDAKRAYNIELGNFTLTGGTVADVRTSSVVAETAGASANVADAYVDTVMGRFFIVGNGPGNLSATFADGSVPIAFSLTAQPGSSFVDEIRAFQSTFPSVALRYIAENDAGEQTEYDFHKVKISADGDLTLITSGDDFANMTLNGLVEEAQGSLYTNSPFLTVRYPQGQ